MEEELLKIIYDYSFNYKTGDKNFINKISEILYNYYNITRNELERIDFFNDIDSKTLGAYYVNERRLSFNVKKLYNSSKNSKLHFIRESDEYLFSNFFILECILHEYNHVLQYKEKKELDNTLLASDKKKLLDYSFLFTDMNIRRKLNITKLNYDSYRKYHDYFPIERMASLESHKQIIELLKLDSSFSEILRDFYYSEYLNMVILGYEYNNTLRGKVSPIQNYLLFTDLYYLYKSFSFYNIDPHESLDIVKQKYSLDERLLYGFPINLEEELDILKKSRDADILLSKHL